MQIRLATTDDYSEIIKVIDEWWGGRKVSQWLPKLFLKHFRNTSFVAEHEGERIGFVVGFFSPAVAEVAYIHFLGVHPDHRKKGVARQLYEQFFQLAKSVGRRRVECMTSTINATSIAFHLSMGFEAKGDSQSDGPVSFYKNYDGPGEDRVLFVRTL